MWSKVLTVSDIDNILKASFDKPQLLFKHSTSCGTSFYALNVIEEEEEMLASAYNCHYLDLLAFRNISNLVAEKWNVKHASPQVILLKNGKVIYTASHSAIQANKILEQIVK